MQNEQTNKDINEYLQILKRRRFALIVPTLLIIIVGIATAFLLPSIYKSTAQILIESQEIPTDYVRSSVTSFVEQRIQNITQKTMSRSKLFEIIRQFNLYPNMRDQYTAEEIIDKMREDIDIDMISADVIDQRTGRPTSATIAFTISYQSKNPEMAQRVCNVLSSLYLEENIKTRERHAVETSSFLEEEATNLKEHINELQKRVADFKTGHMGQLPELININIETVLRLDKEISDLESQIGSLNDRKIYLEGQLALIDPHLSIHGEYPSSEERLKMLKTEYASSSAVFSLDHPDVKRMKREIESLEKELGINTDIDDKMRQLTDARAELAILRDKYTSEHPDVIRLERVVTTLEEEIKSQAPKNNPSFQDYMKPDNPAYINLQTQVASTEFELDAHKNNLIQQKRKRELYQKRLEMMPEVEKEYQSLNIDLATTTQKYNEIQSKLMEAKVSMGLEKEQKGERFTLIDPPAFPEKPFKPNRLAIIIISTILGPGFGLGYMAIAEGLDSTIWTESDLRGTPFQPVLSVVPKIVTIEEIRKKRWGWFILVVATLSLISLTLVLFHYYIMDLEIVWFRVLRHLGRLF